LKNQGHKIDVIRDFDLLRTIAVDIHSNSKKLRFNIFTSSGIEPSSIWIFWTFSKYPLYYELRDDNWKVTPPTIKGTYLNNYKNVWDLDIRESPYQPDTLISGEYNAEEELGNKQILFYQNGYWEYDALVNTYNLNPEKPTMIPFYNGVKGEENAGLNSRTKIIGLLMVKPINLALKKFKNLYIGWFSQMQMKKNKWLGLLII